MTTYKLKPFNLWALTVEFSLNNFDLSYLRLQTILTSLGIDYRQNLREVNE